jgi:hypothetical protein
MAIEKKDLERLRYIKKQLQQNRKRYDDVWKEIARYTNPAMADWNDESGADGGKAPEDTRHIYDNTVIKASQTLTDGVQGYAFARNQAWFKSALEGFDSLDNSESAWLQRGEEHLYSQLNKSNFYDEGRTFVKCCADFGTAIGIRVDDLIRKIPVYKIQHLKWCCIDENDAGEVDVLFRDFWIDAYQAADYFGEGTLPAAMGDAYKQGNLKLWKFTQAILPAGRYNLDITAREGMSYYTVFWAAADETKAVSEGWYRQKPFFVWRWSRSLDGDVWGVESPGMAELPNIKQLNSMRRDRTMASQLAVKPPYKATEGIGKVNLTPNGFTYLRPGKDFTPVVTSGNLQGFDQDIALLQRSINESYFTDLFLILSQNMDKQKTATEVSGIQGEKAAILSAFYGRMTSEFLEPVLEDLFALELEAGRIAPPPGRLQGPALRFDMISPLAQMQKRYLALGSSQQAMAEIAMLVQLNPGVVDNVNFDQYVRTIAEAYGLDKRIVRDLAEVERLRQARAQQQAQMYNDQLEIQQAKAGADLARSVPAGQGVMNGQG